MLFRISDQTGTGLEDLVHIPKFRNGAEKILANASTPDFFGASDIILGYALIFRLTLCLYLHYISQTNFLQAVAVKTFKRRAINIFYL
jgi:hypothetical protein